MQNIKYHAITISSVVLFSYISAVTINGIIKNNLAVYPSEKNRMKVAKLIQKENLNIDINQLIESGFFRTASSNADDEAGDSSSAISDFKLIGTVTGPPGIARALIMKKGEKQPGVFKLWKDVYGFTITGIESSKIYLKKNSETFTLNLFDKKDAASSAKTAETESPGGSVVKKNISRAEMQQKVMNDIDNAMQGIQAGPHRVNGQIEGFKLIRIRPYNILYGYGIRSGDIIKRINGKKVDSTEKLFNMWQGMKNESKMVIDVERNGKIITFEVNITD
ncbi:MAG TPA: PDZ domain-containing protein [Spirochaetota bacterium]|nr:PDZ domain-containing protein [Spirochaetota bacterium]HPS85394.1 PDZ domain-containing protein [Spirochaetota bacterium]